MMHAKVHAISKSKFLGACNLKGGRGMRTIKEWQQHLLGACTGKRDCIPMKQFFFLFFIDRIEPFHEAIHTLFYAQTSKYRSFHTSSGETLVHEQNLYSIVIYDLALPWEKSYVQYFQFYTYQERKKCKFYYSQLYHLSPLKQNVLLSIEIYIILQKKKCCYE